MHNIRLSLGAARAASLHSHDAGWILFCDWERGHSSFVLRLHSRQLKSMYHTENQNVPPARFIYHRDTEITEKKLRNSNFEIQNRSSASSVVRQAHHVLSRSKDEPRWRAVQNAGSSSPFNRGQKLGSDGERRVKCAPEVFTGGAISIHQLTPTFPEFR